MSKREEKGNGKDQTKEVVIYYHVPADNRILPANGCFGGIGPRGELIINFFEETYPIPRTVTHEITNQGSIGRQKETELEAGHLIRHVQASIAVNPGQAESIAKWILQKVEALKKQKRGKE